VNEHPDKQALLCSMMMSIYSRITEQTEMKTKLNDKN